MANYNNKGTYSAGLYKEEENTRTGHDIDIPIK
jgi:hypothetical protein